MWYWVFKHIFWILFTVLFRLKVEGLDNLPQKTNFILAANHASFLDPPCIMAGIPMRVYPIAARHLYKVGLVGWFLRKINAFSAGGSSSLAVKLLMEGKNVGLSPEGKISLNGQLNEFRRGVALLAAKTGRPVVPCAIFGAYEALPYEAKFPKLFSPIKLKIGKPVYLLKEFDDEIDPIYLREGTFKIQNTIKELLNEE
ncbi:MAG: 1-acyl-sn-glycerol-3-phosphate acyltransferase [Candidatus Omnitrophica bacterium]|nr:1-acyl-sn-glycerol-3-phosphate acyltransferase [Candidatus Omnitrophota bacterium]